MKAQVKIRSLSLMLLQILEVEQKLRASKGCQAYKQGNESSFLVLHTKTDGISRPSHGNR